MPIKGNDPKTSIQVNCGHHFFHVVQTAWKKRVSLYWSLLEAHVKEGSIRNILDMNAGFGGFAAALDDKAVWVMNTVPVEEYKKLGVVYDRGLIGVQHDW